MYACLSRPVLWGSRKLQIGKGDAADLDAVGAQKRRRFVAEQTGGGNIVVLIDAVTADPQASHQSRAKTIERGAAGEKNDAALIRMSRLRALRAGVVQVLLKQGTERAGKGPVDPGREKRLGAEPQRSIGGSSSSTSARGRPL